MNTPKLKVAFCNRPNWDNPLGGDGVQMLRTKETLEKQYDIEIDIITDPLLIDNTYCLIHIFNYLTIDVTDSFFDRATSLKIPIVSSSIFWDYSYISNFINKLFVRKYYSPTAAMMVKLASKLLGHYVGRPFVFSRNFKTALKKFVNSSTLILPNSFEEAKLLGSFIQMPEIISKARVVYNATDSSGLGTQKTEAEESEFLTKYRIPANYILQVGRIEFLKNQLNLVYALRDYPNIPIVLLGKVIDQHYYRKIKRIADKRGNVFFLDAVPHSEIGMFYKYARLHVLLSLRESPGLVSLEALSYDCPIVVSNENFTPVNTYFCDQKYIVNPFNLKEIKSVVLKAYEDNILNNDSIGNFTWDIAAEQTYKAYKECLELSNNIQR